MLERLKWVLLIKIWPRAFRIECCDEHTRELFIILDADNKYYIEGGGLVMVSASKRRQIKHLSFPSQDFSAWHDFGLSYYYLLKIYPRPCNNTVKTPRQQMMWVFFVASFCAQYGKNCWVRGRILLDSYVFVGLHTRSQVTILAGLSAGLTVRQRTAIKSGKSLLIPPPVTKTN